VIEQSTDLRALPKIELHLHLDCSLSYEAVSRLAPSVGRDEYDRDYVAPLRCTSLAEFLSRAPKGFGLMQTEPALEPEGLRRGQSGMKPDTWLFQRLA
jgi:adenosine deaminase